MGNYFGHLSDWGQCVRVPVNQSRNYEKVTETINFARKVRQSNLKWSFLWGFISQRIDVFIFVISEIKHFGSKIAVGFHNHPNSLAQTYEHSSEAKLVMEYCFYSNINEAELMQNIKS